MGVGHVPPGPLREAGEGDDVPRRQHRGDRQPLRRQGAVAAARRRSLGSFGEGIAAAFLSRRGATITARNLRSGREEIDIVAIVSGVRVIVEVKTALASSGIDPADNLDRRKVDALARAGTSLDPPIHRIDLIAITIGDDGVGVRWLRDVA